MNDPFLWKFLVARLESSRKHGYYNVQALIQNLPSYTAAQVKHVCLKLPADFFTIISLLLKFKNLAALNVFQSHVDIPKLVNALSKIPKNSITALSTFVVIQASTLAFLHPGCRAIITRRQIRCQDDSSNSSKHHSNHSKYVPM
jgi:hypothetical protein